MVKEKYIPHFVTNRTGSSSFKSNETIIEEIQKYWKDVLKQKPTNAAEREKIEKKLNLKLRQNRKFWTNNNKK